MLGALPWIVRWRQRWRDWWWARLPASDTQALTHRNVYILPSRAGLMLAVTLLVLLVASINYQLNLGYLLTFLLAGCTAVATHVAHNNLRGLQLRAQVVGPVFAGSAAAVDVALINPSRRHRYGIGLHWSGLDQTPGEAAHQPPGTVWSDAPAQATATVRLMVPVARRGRHPVPALVVDSRFPIGTFRVWSWWRPAATVLVYPSPEAAPPPLPTSGADSEQASAAQAARTQDDWDQLRPWRPGDPLKRVVWKKVARQPEPGHWISRDSSPAPAGPLWLDTAHCGLSDLEAQRSRLCAWVLAAEQQGKPYGLKCGSVSLPPDRGPIHQAQCLEALALC